MSRVRAQRRAEREQVAAAREAARRVEQERAMRRRERRRALRERLPRRTRSGRHQGLLARRRRMQNGLVLGVFLAAQAVVFLLTGDPWVRAASILLGLAAVPVLVTLVFDRRS